MPTPSSLGDLTAERAAELDELLRSLQSSQGQLGTQAQASAQQRNQLLQAYGLQGGVPQRQLGLQDSPAPGPQAIASAGPSPIRGAREQTAAALGQLGRQAAPQIPGLDIQLGQQLSPQVAGLDIQLPPQPSGLDIPLRRGNRNAWMQNPRAVERTALTMAGKARDTRGKGKGRFVPFNSMPGQFQVQFLAESGVSEVPAGWWTGDLGRREKTLLNRMAASGAQEMSLKNRTAQATGTAADYQRRLALAGGGGLTP